MERFELTEELILLVSKMYISWDDCEYGAPSIDPKRPYGNSSVEEDICEILGCEVVYNEEEDRESYSEDDLERARELHLKTKTALQLILKFKTFEPAVFERENNWGKWTKVSEGIGMGDNPESKLEIRGEPIILGTCCPSDKLEIYDGKMVDTSKLPENYKEILFKPKIINNEGDTINLSDYSTVVDKETAEKIATNSINLPESYYSEDSLYIGDFSNNMQFHINDTKGIKYALEEKYEELVREICRDEIQKALKNEKI